MRCAWYGQQTLQSPCGKLGALILTEQCVDCALPTNATTTQPDGVFVSELGALSMLLVHQLHKGLRMRNFRDSAECEAAASGPMIVRSAILRSTLPQHVPLHCMEQR